MSYKERITQLTSELAEARDLPGDGARPSSPSSWLFPDRIIGYIDSLVEKQRPLAGQRLGVDPNCELPAKEVVLMNQHGKILSYGRVKLPREDVAENFQNNKLEMCGWALSFPVTQLDRGPNVVQAFAYDAEQRRGTAVAGRIRGADPLNPSEGE